MLTTIIASIVFFLVAFSSFDNGVFFGEVSSNNSIWIAFLSYLGVRGVVLALLFKGSVNKFKLQTAPRGSDA